MSHLLTAEEILGADDLPKELVQCDEWGGHVYVRAMTSRERDSWEQCIVTMRAREEEAGVPESERGENAGAILLSRVICDESGKPMFSLAQTEELGQKSSTAMGRCYRVAARLNHLTTEDVDEAVKNLNGDQSGDSGSA